MVSAAMVMEEKHGTDEKVPSNECAPKVRKIYTITKQRERWSEDEHNKFLEALKLHGRAWRKIEEHVATKTAVQIRSHAQKFFSKVVRESNTGDAGSIRPIEIPPPRPKRKPMHPYPRTHVSTVIPVLKNPTSSASPNVLERDNQSPTSVLSTVGSDSSIVLDPGTTPSSVSSVFTLTAGNSAEGAKLLEGAVSSLPNHDDESSSQDGQIPLALDLSAAQLVKNVPSESSAQSLKLFGKTFLVTGTNNQSNSDSESCKPWRATPLKCSTDASNPTNFPWLTLCSDRLDSSPAVHSPIPINPNRNEETNSRKGFVPYKRCLSEQDPSVSSSGEHEKQRIRLYL